MTRRRASTQWNERKTEASTLIRTDRGALIACNGMVVRCKDTGLHLVVASGVRVDGRVVTDPVLFPASYAEPEPARKALVALCERLATNAVID